MVEIVPLVSVFAVFVPALVLPGPDFVAVVRVAMTRGARAGIFTALGTTIGLVTYAALSIFGLSALLAQVEWLTIVVRVLGGAYLVYLGVRLVRTPPDQLDIGDAPAPAPIGARRAVLGGLLVNLTNPKAIVLFASVFATAITPQTHAATMALMVVLVGVTTLVWYTLVSLFMASPPVIQRFAGARHRIERIAGVAFVAIGGKLIADARSPVST
ncbi:LysE family translocator [Acuticoccus sp. I52.16.1]|uniref:LysE family translocator n=1 Tax=Acuticoccus sp. I52.16.1 TaxID=2928472 RepID=UPI001FD53F73|nr:LysE family transporter [Acuticoccus sp. I52.16.1]UOM34558.1 LysE family transporter [Acuticoccus sp. I52.16.1]